MRLLAGDSLDADDALMASLVREPRRPGDVPDGVNAFNIGAAVAVGFDMATVGLHAQSFETDVLRIRHNADCDDGVRELLRLDLAVLALDGRGDAVRACLQLLDSGAHVD